MPSKPHKAANRPLDAGDVRSIHRHHSSGKSIAECARIHACDRKTIRRVLQGGHKCRDNRKPKKQCQRVTMRRAQVARLAKATFALNGQRR
jgi:DNA invertase Pin-like site-specific DNA recombinase